MVVGLRPAVTGELFASPIVDAHRQKKRKRTAKPLPQRALDRGGSWPKAGAEAPRVAPGGVATVRYGRVVAVSLSRVSQSGGGSTR